MIQADLVRIYFSKGDAYNSWTTASTSNVH